MFQFIPKDDFKQALRIRRFLMAFVSYVIWTGLVAFGISAGFFRLNLGQTFLYIALPLLLVQLGIYALLRSGINKRFDDPSLTMGQMIVATLVISTTLYFTNQGRGVFLMVYLVTFVFGIFRLKMGQFLLITVIALASFGLSIIALYLRHPGLLDMRQEVLQLIVLAAVLPWLSTIGAYISRLRHNITTANARLSEAFVTIEQMAIMDPLTNVCNRRKLLEILEQEMGRTNRGGPVFSVCMIDIDHFKKVNDRFGHIKGDLVLEGFAKAIKDALRSHDTLARFGGEEFVVVLPQTGLAGAISYANRMRSMVETLRFSGLPDSFSITISIGVASYEPGESIESLLARADAAMYSAKAQGRNCVAA
jgi:diguanylate cyclase (GGDEF)-like protein